MKSKKYEMCFTISRALGAFHLWTSVHRCRPCQRSPIIISLLQSKYFAKVEGLFSCFLVGDDVAAGCHFSTIF